MAKKMIISAISSLAAPTSGIKPSFAVSPTENMMDSSKDKAPVLLRIDYAGTVTGKDFALMMSEDSEIGLEETALYLNGLGEFLCKCASEATSVDITFGRVEVTIGGALEAGDMPAVEGVNQAQFAFIPNDEMKRTFAQIECHVPADACPASVKRIRDVETGENAIRGLNPFYLQGTKMTYGGVGEKLELLEADGKTFVQALEVVKHDCEVSIQAKLTAPVEDGRYFVSLTTLAGGEKTLWPVGCYTEVVGCPVKPVKIVSKITGNEDEVRLFNDELTVTGPEILNSSDIYLSLYDASGEMRARMEDQPTVHPERVDAKTWKYHIGGNTSTAIDDEWFEETYTPYLTVERNGAEDLLIPIKTVR